VTSCGLFATGWLRDSNSVARDTDAARPAVEPPQPRPSLEYGEGRTNWAKAWSEDSIPEDMLWVHWKRRWLQHPREPPGHRSAPAPASPPVFSYDALKKHRHLLKHESSLFTQIRTGKVGLTGEESNCETPAARRIYQFESLLFLPFLLGPAGNSQSSIWQIPRTEDNVLS
jgi:hypothetical protein